ncbi:hypothetical protein [Solidesulfovibrio sp. C21]|uniref:hypothetical protein n=1 Tax=Solidesulfovibrio sp. C21 TaxID=3398613 RepID=UPI0039FD4D6D
MDISPNKAVGILAQLLSELDKPGGPDTIQWPKELKNEKDYIKLFLSLLDIVRAISIESSAFKSKYCGKTSANKELNNAMILFCTSIYTFELAVTKDSLSAICDNASSVNTLFATLDVTFIKKNSLSSMYGDVYNITNYCEKFTTSINNLKAQGFIDKLKDANKKLQEFKDTLDKIAETTETVAEVAAFIAEVLAVLVKFLPLLL